jgi:enoyl-CoA hydratase
MRKTYQTLEIKTASEHTEVVYLNRPEALNAINTQLAKDLRNYFSTVNKKNTKLRCIVLTGKGEKAFCAGADLKERKGMSDKDWFKQHHIFEEAGDSISSCPLPLIAAVNGFAFGGGCELAMACDFIFASSQAIFAQPEVKLGIIPGLGGTQRLPRLVGLNRAKELLFTGKRFSAEEALKWGLVNEILEPQDLLPHSLKVAEAISLNGPFAIKQVKRAVDRGFAIPIVKALEVEIEAYNNAAKTKDRREGIIAFNEKRSPKFSGR